MPRKLANDFGVPTAVHRSGSVDLEPIGVSRIQPSGIESVFPLQRRRGGQRIGRRSAKDRPPKLRCGRKQKAAAPPVATPAPAVESAARQARIKRRS